MSTTTSSLIKLWHCHDARSLRPLWCLEELGLEYELVELPFPPRVKQKAFLSKNVLGTVPYLEYGSVTMTESVAICHYLVDCHGDGELSINQQHRDYPDYLNWLYHSDATLTFPQTIYLRYAKFAPPEHQHLDVAEDYKKWFLARLRRLNQHLLDRDYLCNNTLTIADICVGYALFLAHTLGFSDKFEPQLKTYLSRLTERPAFVKARSLSSQVAPF